MAKDTLTIPTSLVPSIPGKQGGKESTPAWQEMVVPVAVLIIVIAMITPMPSFLLDLLISANITLSVIVLLVSMYIVRAVEFSVFPTVLLLLTLFRLALNISSSRLILLNGNLGASAAGGVIEAFGQFVVGGNYIIGLVIFLVLIAIQYVVINHGAVRISEVTARFALDALPGKQMSIDSDLNAGLIDEAEARLRRRKLSAEAEFFGAMDGASRFSQRDAVASILITSINIVAGFLIGVFQHGMELRRALETYTVLTIGDGLVTVIPALMISISGGLIVTRAGSESRIGAEFQAQMMTNSQPLYLASCVLIGMAAFPGLPGIPFLFLGAATGFVAWRMKPDSTAEEITPSASSQKAKESVETLLRIDPLALEVGLGLVKLAAGGNESQLLRRIAGIRRQLATELGYLLPAVRLTDNLSLKAREYSISLKSVEIGRFELPPGMELAIAATPNLPSINGIPTKEPAFGIPAFWISPDQVEIAKANGYTVVDTVGIIGTHLSELIRRHAHELLTRQDTKNFLDRVAEENPKVVEDLVPKLLSLASVQRVLQNLLRERVSIRDSSSILEALSEGAAITKNAVLLTEYVRQTIRRLLIKPYANATGEILGYFLDAGLEQTLEGGIDHNENTSVLNLNPATVRDVANRIARVVGQADSNATIVCGSACRFFVRQIVENSLPNLVVLAHSEIPSGVRVRSLGVIT